MTACRSRCSDRWAHERTNRSRDRRRGGDHGARTDPGRLRADAAPGCRAERDRGCRDRQGRDRWHRRRRAIPDVWSRSSSGSSRATSTAPASADARSSSTSATPLRRSPTAWRPRCSSPTASRDGPASASPGSPGRAARPRSSSSSPYGVTGAPTMFPIGVVRYMKELGLTHEQLASVAVVQRQWAAMNPRAMMREPITVDDVLASPLVAYPMHRLECCLVTDGGGALLVTSAERARDMDLPHPPVYVAGTGEALGPAMISQMDDFTTSAAFRLSGPHRVRERGHRTHRRRPPHGVRRVRAPPDLRARGSRLRGPRRSRGVHRGGEHRTRWITPDEHERRRALVHAHRDVRHVRHPGVGAAAARQRARPRCPTSR